jgi:hypothetical protein
MANHNVFISWSGDRSKAVALALHDWLPKVVQAARPWMSEVSIEKGTRGLVEVVRALEGINIGIVCLTPENLHHDWLLFESGALTKHLSDTPRLCTYLFGGIKSQDVAPPLGMFQWTLAEKADTKKLLTSVNSALGTPVLEKNLDVLFEKMWPDLQASLDVIGPAANPVPNTRSVPDMVAELLDLARSEASKRAEFDVYRPILDQLMPSLEAAIRTLPPPQGGNRFGGYQSPILRTLELMLSAEVHRQIGAVPLEIVPDVNGGVLVAVRDSRFFISPDEIKRLLEGRLAPSSVVRLILDPPKGGPTDAPKPTGTRMPPPGYSDPPSSPARKDESEI